MQRIVDGKITNERGRQISHVPRRRIVIGLRQTRGIDEVGIRHTQLPSILIHQISESGLISGNELSQRDTRIVSRLNDDALEQILERHLLSHLDALTHHGTVHQEVHEDSVAGERVSSAGVDRLQDAGAVESFAERRHDSLAVGAGKSTVAVRRRDKAEPPSSIQRRADGLRRLAPAHGMIEERERPAVVLGVAVLGVYFDNGRARVVEHVPIDTAHTRRIRKVMRNH